MRNVTTTKKKAFALFGRPHWLLTLIW